MLPKCPYVGLTPFSEADAPFFFGREEDCRILISNLTAARLTLVYGPSGVGKSSLLHAGVARDLRAAADAALEEGCVPESIVVVFASWRERPLAQLAALIAKTVGELIERLPVSLETLGGSFEFDEASATASPPPLDELLATWNERLDELARRLERETGVRQPEHVELLIVLDQFEEYFLYHPDESGSGTFAGEFVRAVNRAGLRANFLVSIREDAYTQLDRFEEDIPGLFGNNIRIEHLGRAAAEEAIRGPVRRYAERGGSDDTPDDVEDALVAAVLKQVKTGTLGLGQTGGGVIESNESEADLRVETPFLQLVMERLWHEEREAGSRLLRLETLDRLGGANLIVRTHLDQAVAALDPDAQDIAARVFGRLVTPSGTKIAYLPSDLAALENVSTKQLSPMLEGLTQARILRAVARAPGEKEPHFEIFHDVLAPAVLDWRARWLQAQEHAEAERRLNADLEKQKEERLAAEQQARLEQETAGKFRMLFKVTGTLMLVAVGLAVWAVVERHKTNVATHHAEVSDLQTKMTAALARDPAQAITLAVQAVKKERSTDKQGWAVTGLRQALQQSALIAALRPEGGAVRDVAFSSDRGLVLTVAGRNADLWSAVDGRHIRRLSAGTDLLDASLSANGKFVVGGDADGRILRWNVSSGRLRILGQAGGPIVHLSFSPKRGRVLAATDDGEVTIRSARDGGRVRSLRAGRSLVAAEFSRDGTLVLTASEKRACVWSSRTGDLRGVLGGVKPCVHRGDQSVASGSAFSSSVSKLRVATFGPNSRFVVIGYDTGDASVWDVKTGRELGSHRMSGAVTSGAFDAKSKRVVTGAADGSVHVWQAKTGKLTVALRGHTDQVGSVAFSADGRWILTGSDDQTAAIWNAATGRREAVLPGHSDSVERAVFGKSRILTASDDGTGRLWRLPLQRPDRAFVGMLLGEFSQDGRRLAISRFEGATIVDLSSRRHRPLRTFPPYTIFATFTPDDSRVLTLSFSKIASWDAKTWRPIASIKTTWSVLWRDVSNDSRWAVLATSRALRLWDTGRAKPLHLERAVPFSKRDGSIQDVSVSDDGRYLAVAQSSGVAKVWDLRTHQPLSKGAAKVWNLRTHRPLSAFRLASTPTFKLSPDGSEVVGTAPLGQTKGLATERSGTTVWATRTGKPLFVLPTRGVASVVRFSPRGTLLVTAGDGNAARVWNAHKPKRIAVLRGHTGKINDVAFSPNGTFVATASDDGTVRVWVARTGTLVGTFRQGATDPARRVIFDAKGRRVLATGEHDSGAIYTCSVCVGIDDLLQLAGKLRPGSVAPSARPRSALRPTGSG